MTIEVSHGKARPTLPRASDLSRAEGLDPPAEAAPIRSSRGRPRSGARAVQAGDAPLTSSPSDDVRAMVPGQKMPDEDALAVADDAQAMHAALMRDVGPCASLAVVQAMGVRAARWFALAGYYGAKADAIGPSTELGMRFVEMEIKCCSRAERCSVTMLDFARVFGRTPEAGEDPEDIARRAEREAQRRRDERAVRSTVDTTGEPTG